MWSRTAGAVADVFQWHHYSPTPEAGVSAVFKGGMDLICGDYRRNMSTEREAIVNAVHQGLLPEAVIDLALRRLFTARFRLGLFDPPSAAPYSRVTAAENDTEVHRQLALRMARESIVLLKTRTISPAEAIACHDRGDRTECRQSGCHRREYNGTPSKPVTILTGIRNRYPNSKIVYVEGTGLVGPGNEIHPHQRTLRGRRLP